MNEFLKKIVLRFLDVLKSKPYLSGSILLIVVVFLVPFIICLPYYIGENHVCIINTNLLVGDVLCFYGTALSFFGTTLLGAIAIWQNKRLQRLESDTNMKDSSCSVLMSTYKGSSYSKFRLSHDADTPYHTSTDIFTFNIQNCSEAFLKEIEIDFNGTKFHSNITLIKGEKRHFYIFLPEGLDKKINKYSVTFTSCYDVKTYGEIVLSDDGRGVSNIKYYHFYGTRKMD